MWPVGKERIFQTESGVVQLVFQSVFLFISEFHVIKYIISKLFWLAILPWSPILPPRILRKNKVPAYSF